VQYFISSIWWWAIFPSFKKNLHCLICLPWGYPPNL
jgi:hypothetical protein